MIAAVPFFWATSTEGSSAFINLVYFLPIAGVIGFCIYALFFKTQITVTDDSVYIVSAGVFKKRINFAELAHVRRGPNTSLSNGVGMRVMPERRLGYLTGGPSVKFIMRDGAVVVASAQNPSAVIDDVRSRLAITEFQEVA